MNCDELITEKINTISQLIEKMNAKSPGVVVLNPVISPEKVKAFEKRHQISLPKEYVAFITRIGDGAIIQSAVYGTQKLLSLGKYDSSKYPLKNIGLPFPLERSWIPEWGNGLWELGIKEIPTKEDAVEAILAEQTEKIKQHGNIVVMEDTPSKKRWILVINGSHQGEIWYASKRGAFRLIDCDYLHWLELYLSYGLDDFMTKCKNREYSYEIDLIERCNRFLTREQENITMFPPVSRKEVLAFEQRHHITLPKDYVTFLTKVGNGAQKSPWYLSPVYSLSDIDVLDDLDQPFLFQTKSAYQAVCLNEYGYEKPFGTFGDPTMWNCLFPGEDFRQETSLFPWFLPQFGRLHGCIPIAGNWEYRTQYILILNGCFRGEIWRADDKTLSRRSDHTKITTALKKEIPINVLTLMEAITYWGV